MEDHADEVARRYLRESGKDENLLAEAASMLEIEDYLDNRILDPQSGAAFSPTHPPNRKKDLEVDMILDCHQCSSCYFEDKEPSSRIDDATISLPQPKMVFRNVLVVFVCMELYDSKQELEEAVEEFASLSDL